MKVAAKNVNPVVVVTLAIGALLIYCAIQDKTPVQAFQDAFAQTGGGKSKPVPKKSTTPPKTTPPTMRPKR